MAEGLFNAAEQGSNLRALQGHIAAHRSGKALPGLGALLESIRDGADVVLCLCAEDKVYLEENKAAMISASKAAQDRIARESAAENLRIRGERRCH